MDRRRALLAVLVLALAALAGCEAPPQTEEVCDGCVTGVREAAPAVAVEDSVTHVYLRESGDARVEARIELSGSGVDELRANETRREQVRTAVARQSERAEETTYEDRTRPAFPRTDLAVAMDGQTLVVRFRYPEFTERRAGATLADGFYRLDGEGRESNRDDDQPTEFETDRLVVHGPENTRSLVTPPGSTDERDRLVWTDGTVPPRTYLAFGGLGPAGRAAVALDVLGWAGSAAVAPAVFAGVVLLAPAVLLAGYYRRLEGAPDWDPQSDRLFWTLVGLELTLLGLVTGWAAINALAGGIAALLAAATVVLAYANARGIGRGTAPPGERAPGDANDDPPSGGPADPSGGAPPGSPESAPPTGDEPSTDASDPVDGGGTVPRPNGAGASATGAVGEGTLGQFRDHALAVVATAAATLALTAVVAVDYTAAYVGTLAFAGMVVPLVTLPVLGYLVTVPDRGPHVVGVVGATVGAAWVVSFSRVVHSGAEDTEFLVLFAPAWALVAGAVGLLGFYAVLWGRSR